MFCTPLEPVMGEAELAADAEVHLAHRERPTHRAKPFHHMLGLAHRQEDEAGRRIEAARYDDGTVGR